MSLERRMVKYTHFSRSRRLVVKPQDVETDYELMVKFNLCIFKALGTLELRNLTSDAKSS